MSDDADPILAAVEKALQEQGTAWWQTPPRLDLAADVAVEAHRRAVLDRRDDGERWATLVELAEKSQRSILATEGAALLAALADAEIACRQADADRDVLVQVRDEAVGKTADYAELSAILTVERDALRHGYDDALGRLSEADALLVRERRFAADLTARGDALAERVDRVRGKVADLLDGELAHRSRDYGRGVAQASRDILAALDGE